jgi:hypothetical protein
MNIQTVRFVGAGGRRPAWRPALAQPVTASLMTPPSAAVPDPRTPFIDSALFNFVFSALGATVSGMLSYYASGRRETMAYVTGIAAGILGIKALSELQDVRKR